MMHQRSSLHIGSLSLIVLPVFLRVALMAGLLPVISLEVVMPE